MNCKNCAQKLHEDAKFCDDCGAKVITNRLTIKSIASETTAAFFNIDTNKPLRTFVDMFVRPEAVIGGYIDGVRKKYINAFGYFTIAVTFTGFFFFFFSDIYSAALQGINEVQGQNEVAAKVSQDMNQSILDYQSVLFFLFIPFFALLSRLVFLKNKKYNYAEHLVINLYTQSQTSILSILVYFITVWSESLFSMALAGVLPFQILYYSYVLKRLYSLSLLQIFLKLLLFLVLLVPLMIGLAILMWAFLFLSGKVDFNEFMEAEKAKRALSYIAPSVMNWTS